MPEFVTDVSETERFIGDRNVVSIVDEDAHVTYRLVMLETEDCRRHDFFDWISKRFAV